MVGLLTFMVAVALLGDESFVSASSSTGKKFIFTTVKEVDLHLASVDADTSNCDIMHGKTRLSKVVSRLPSEIAVNGTVTIDCSTEISAIIRTTNATSLLLPVQALGTKYIVPVQKLVLTATSNDTKVSLNCTGDSELQLSEGEFENVNGCVVETQINSTKPISMMAADESVNIPPVTVWGREYVLERLPSGQSYLVIGASGDAVCKQNGSKVDGDSIGSGQLECEGGILVATQQGNKLMSVVYSTTRCSNSVTMATNGSSKDSKLVIELRKKFANDELVINGKVDNGEKRNHMEDIGDFTRLYYPVDSDVYDVSHRNPTAKMCAWVEDKDGRVLALSPISLPATGEHCKKSNAIDNDAIDNDCDYQVDEELLNGVDDDEDGLIDEDTATNEFYGDLRDNSGNWPLSYTVVIIVLFVILLLILIAVCHWQCAKFNPEVKDTNDDLMVTSYSSRAGSMPARYSLSGSRSGFTISRR